MIFLPSEIVKEFIKIRKEAGLTQEKLAKIMMSSESRISMFENYKFNPSLEWLVRYAFACGKVMKISFVDGRKKKR